MIEQDAGKQSKTKRGIGYWLLSPLRWYGDFWNMLFDLEGLFYWLVGEDTFKWRWAIFSAWAVLGSVGLSIWKAIHFQDWGILLDALWPLLIVVLGVVSHKAAKKWRERAEAAREIAERRLQVLEKAMAMVQGLETALEKAVNVADEAMADKRQALSRLEEAAAYTKHLHEEILAIGDEISRLNETLPPQLAEMREWTELAITEYEQNLAGSSLNDVLSPDYLTTVEMADRTFKEYEQRIAALEAELNLERGLVGFADLFRGQRKSQAILQRYELFRQIEKDYPTLTNQGKALKATERARGEIEGELARGRRSNGNIETEIILEMSRRYKAKDGGFSQTDIENYHRDLGKEINRRNAQ